MFRPCEIKSPFTKKSLRKVPSKSPFAKSLRKVPSVAARTLRAATARATAPRAAWLGGASARRPRPPSHGRCGGAESQTSNRQGATTRTTHLHT